MQINIKSNKSEFTNAAVMEAVAGLVHLFTPGIHRFSACLHFEQGEETLLLTPGGDITVNLRRMNTNHRIRASRMFHTWFSMQSWNGFDTWWMVRREFLHGVRYMRHTAYENEAMDRRGITHQYISSRMPGQVALGYFPSAFTDDVPF